MEATSNDVETCCTEYHTRCEACSAPGYVGCGICCLGCREATLKTAQEMDLIRKLDGHWKKTGKLRLF